MSDAAHRYAELLERAEADPKILAFWLDGARGKGRADLDCGYACTLVVADEAQEDYAAAFGGFGEPQLICRVMTLAGFEAHAAWGSDTAGEGYNYAHLRALVDKTGQVQALIDAKAHAPEAVRPAFIEASIDRWISQAYRALQCQREGQGLAARLEAAQGIAPLLDAVFALHQGRLRPYPRYLEWELDAHPLQALPWDAEAFLAKLAAVLDTGDIAVQRELVQGLAPVFRAAGHRVALDRWDAAWPWLLDVVAPPGPAEVAA